MNNGKNRSITACWDTSTVDGLIVLGRGEEVLASEPFLAEKGHSGWLMATLASLLERTGIEKVEIARVACTTGPGTFTGVKVGIASAKAVSFGLGIPVVGIPTLDLYARIPVGERFSVSVMDARRGEYYAAAYHTSGEGITRIGGFIHDKPAGVVREVLARIGTHAAAGDDATERIALIGVGTGQLALSPPWADCGACFVPYEIATGLLAHALLAETESRVHRGAVDGPLTVEPVYLKKPV